MHLSCIQEELVFVPVVELLRWELEAATRAGKIKDPIQIISWVTL
jgi:hypothetical protein